MIKMRTQPIWPKGEPDSITNIRTGFFDGKLVRHNKHPLFNAAVKTKDGWYWCTKADVDRLTQSPSTES